MLWRVVNVSAQGRQINGATVTDSTHVYKCQLTSGPNTVANTNKTYVCDR